MSTTGRPAEASEAAAVIESAGFVRIVVRADGDALAAGGVLARALSDRGTPFQVSVASTVDERTDRVDDGDCDAAIVVGAVDGDADAVRLDGPDRPASLAAADLARELGATADPVLALAGAFAVGVEPGAGETEWLLENARSADLLERRPGVAVPTADPIDGLAHSGLVRAPWSGDPAATREALSSIGAIDSVDATDPSEVGEDDRRRLASIVAVDAVGADEATEAAARAIGRVLRPYATPAAPFATLGGYADVLDAVARSRPGTGVALAIDHGVGEAALEGWRDHGRALHAAIDGASTGRYDGLLVVGIDDGPVESVARTIASYRSPEPVVLAIGDGEAAIATRESGSLDAAIEAIARDLEAAYDAGRRRGYLEYDSSQEEKTIIDAVRGTL